MQCKLATLVSDQVLYDVWMAGYSDYLIKIDIKKQDFIQRFMEIESARKYSFVAYEGEQPIGLILGNIAIYDDVKTMRCGGFAVIPTHRNRGVGKMLLEHHYHLAKENGCKHLYLEVLKKNEKAVKFYKTNGYVPVYDYKYFKKNDVKLESNLHVTIEEVAFDTIKTIRASLPELHIFWQGEMFVVDKLDGIRNYVIKEKDDIVAAISMKNTGLINFIWVKGTLRQQGYGKALVCHGMKMLSHNNLLAITSNNYVYEGFIRHLGLTLELEQYEMMLPIEEDVWNY